jgi:uncharacterized repeat protein (TIGR01451 family)
MGHFSPSVGGLATNTAFVSTTEAFDPGHYKLASDLTLVRTLAVTLSGSTVAATPPTTIVLTTTLANQGTVAAENVEVSFSTPPGLTFSGNTGACTTPFPCALGTMPPSSERRVTTTVELPQGYPGPDSLAFVVAATTMTAAATAPENTDQWFVRVLRPRPATFHLVEPCRLLDTRSSTPIAAGATRTVVATGSCRVPASARSLALNVTVDAPTGDGHLRLFPGITLDGSTASAINFRAGQTRANNAVVGLGGAGDVSILAEITGGWVHVILDVNGYFE